MNTFVSSANFSTLLDMSSSKSFIYIKNSIMFASFYSEGTIPFSSDSGVLICSTISLSSFGGVPSTPSDLLSFIFLIFFAIIC